VILRRHRPPQKVNVTCWPGLQSGPGGISSQAVVPHFYMALLAGFRLALKKTRQNKRIDPRLEFDQSREY
jgi:hypothetical protein